MLKEPIIKIFGNNHIYYYLVCPFHRSIILWVLIVVKIGLYQNNLEKD